MNRVLTTCDAVLNTDQGKIRIYDNSRETVTFALGNSRVTMRVPNESQLLRDNILTTFQRGNIFTTSDASQLLKLIAFTTLVGVQLDGYLIEERKRLLEEKAESDAKEAEKIAARQALIIERKEQCLNEFVGDKIRVRSRGYKGSPRAKMTAKPIRRFNETINEYVETGEYEPFIVFDNEDVDGSRPRRIEDIRKLEVKEGKRYRVVWDDGDDDLPLYEREEGKRMMNLEV